MMNIPGQVKIGPVTYTVEFRYDLRDGDTKLNGWVRHNECEIFIDDSLNPQRAQEVIWHEVIHAILDQAGHDDLSENAVSALSFGIVGALQQNPWLANVGYDPGGQSE